MKLTLAILLAASIIASLEGNHRKSGFGPVKQDWGFYTIRKVAHYFYWLFYTKAPDARSPFERPLVIYLSGGPGISSTGYGNFAEVGPFHANGTKRPSSWVNYVNLLFIDIPIGTGYSYADFGNPLAQNNKEIGADTVRFLTKFYRKHPGFSAVPLYIFGEGYGGKMAVEIAKQLDTAIKENKLEADFRGIGLGDAWISPLDSCKTWGPYLAAKGLVDEKGRVEIENATNKLEWALGKGHYNTGANLFMNLKEIVLEQVEKARGVDLDNDLHPLKIFKRSAHFRSLDMKRDLLHFEHRSKGQQSRVIEELMKNDVRWALGIAEDRNYQIKNDNVFLELKGDFMKPVTSVVEELLNNTNLKVAVYNGQLDAMVTTFGTQRWIEQLQWPGNSGWKSSFSEPFTTNDDIILGYVKNYNNLYYYSVDRAGNSVPFDNPDAGIEILRRVTEFDKKVEKKQKDSRPISNLVEEVMESDKKTETKPEDLGSIFNIFEVVTESVKKIKTTTEPSISVDFIDIF